MPQLTSHGSQGLWVKDAMITGTPELFRLGAPEVISSDLGLDEYSHSASSHHSGLMRHLSLADQAVSQKAHLHVPQLFLH